MPSTSRTQIASVSGLPCTSTIVMPDILACGAGEARVVNFPSAFGSQHPEEIGKPSPIE
jgi:hypothetical protein